MEMVLPKFVELGTTAIGFILFVWVLAKFAWGPILDLLDERRKKIEGDYEAAEKNLAEAESLKGEFELKLTDIKVIERERVQDAVKRGEEMADGIVTKARGQADETRHKAEQDIDMGSPEGSTRAAGTPWSPWPWARPRRSSANDWTTTCTAS